MEQKIKKIRKVNILTKWTAEATTILSLIMKHNSDYFLKKYKSLT